MSAIIKYGNNVVVENLESGKTANLPVTGKQMSGDIKVTAVKDQPNVAELDPITPEEDTQYFSAEARGLDGFSVVEVNPIPSNYKDVSNLNATASMVLNGKSFYGANGKGTGSMPDHYTDGEYQLTLDASNPSEELNGAYRGTVNINIANPTTITSNGTHTASSGTVWSSVTVNVQVPVWDGKGISYS